ncbi:Pirin-like protein YhhW [Enhygromyxa salina]|uniref:Pirin-like protein YhhW n=1 Tax=Enhygromyxa salina TaxID=215803 RepID=A0A0C2DIB5_9BACT|nr:pirin family protein [Enhygromyxa salina]KIG19407.1 Pirin-like protein YhhW [Enhygromyxa salina]
MRRREILEGALALGAIGPVSQAIGCVQPPSGAAGQQQAAAAGARAPARVLQRIVAHPAIDGAGATVQRVFPGPDLRHLDPFVVLDDFDVRRPAGFPDHPHRGFEAFTYMIEGAFHHRDSMGNDSVIGPGGTQRFSSGSGARHSEMPGTDGANRGLQLWVNLPRRLKQMAPSYAGIAGADMPVFNGEGHVLREVVGPRSPVVLQTEVEYFDLELFADASFEHEVLVGRNALIYVLEGEVSLLGERVGAGEAVLPTSGVVTIGGVRRSRVLWLSGKPHGEPINQRGPYVD